MGPEGVGKRSLANAMAKCWYGNPDAVYRIHCSDFAHKFEANSLLFSGNDLGTRPCTVFLVESIEYASKELLRFFSMILERGEVATPDNSKITSLENVIFIFTLNSEHKSLFYKGKKKEAGSLDWEKEIKEVVPSSLLYQIQSVASFHSLHKQNIHEIVLLTDKAITKVVSNQKR